MCVHNRVLAHLKQKLGCDLNRYEANRRLRTTFEGVNAVVSLRGSQRFPDPAELHFTAINRKAHNKLSEDCLNANRPLHYCFYTYNDGDAMIDTWLVGSDLRHPSRHSTSEAALDRSFPSSSHPSRHLGRFTVTSNRPFRKLTPCP